MFKYLKKYWVFCLLAPLFMVGEVAMDLLQPELMSTIVDDGVLTENMTVILSVGIRMIVLVLLGGISGILSGVFANLAAQKFANDLRKAVFAKIMRLSFEQTDKISTGSLVTRLTNDITQVQNMVMMLIRMAVRNGVMFFGGIIMLYLQSPKFALITVCTLPFLIGIIFFFMFKASPMFSIVQKKLDGVNNVMQEDVTGARVVKAYVKEDYELRRFDRANGELCGINLKVQSLLAFMSPLMNIIMNVCVVAVLWVAGVGAVTTASGASAGDIMASITYVSLIMHGVLMVANIFQTFTRAKASSARIREVLDADDIIIDGNCDNVPSAAGEIEFRNVSFSYPDANYPVIRGVSFKINAGETFAILGATGSGKSTLVHLIPRFYDATEGEILVDGVNVKDYKLKTLRDRVGIVLQKAELYSRSIEANIRWGKDEATPFEIKKAAEIAQADDFICKKLSGYYTQVTEGGHSLSGGQKQRISVARSVLKDSEILIFDDSTSALDLSTEAKLYAALNKERPNATKIIIAQRIASVKNANRIAVLDKGKIVALGSHAELMSSSPIYRDIYNSQLKED